MENTLAGSVHENYDHLLHFDVRIAAETNVRIVHNLIVPPGVRFADLRKVYSHPVALNQCLKFFARYPKLERVPFYDTAGSVKMVMEKNAPGCRRHRLRVAATIYGGAILKRSIEDDRRNFTRFFLLYPSKKLPPPRHCQGMEDFAGVHHAQHPGSSVPRLERVRAARFEPDQDRIPAAARQAVGVFVLPGFVWAAKTSRACRTRCGIWPRSRIFCACWEAIRRGAERRPLTRIFKPG